jgi:hypothetical protein
MANNDPQPGVPTATGTLQGVAPFRWSGSAWVAATPEGSATTIASGTISAGGFTPRVTATLTRPSDATQYAIGDLIGNSGTANLVVPISFTVARAAGGSGRITGARCVVAAASATIVLPAFDLLLFRPESGIPFAAAGYPADNAALNVSAAAMAEKVGIMAFSATGWRNQAGGATAAGPAVYQSVVLSSGRPYAPFNLASCGGSVVLGLLQAQNTWNPGAVVQTISLALDVDQD